MPELDYAPVVADDEEDEKDKKYPPVRPSPSQPEGSDLPPVASGAPLASSDLPFPPPVAPSIPNAPPAGAYPPVAPAGGPDLRADALSGRVAPPSSSDAAYQPVKQSRKAEILNRIGAGLAGYRNPEVGVQIRRNFEQEPIRQANERYNRDTAQYNAAFNQGIAQENATGEKELRGAQVNNLQSEVEQRSNPNSRLSPEIQSYFKIPGNEKKTVLDYEKDKAAAGAAGKPAEGEIPLGDKVDSFNKILTAQYQASNPDKPLPPEMVLPPTATQKDYDRRESVIKSMEAASATKEQRNIGNALREQAAKLSEQNQQDREERQGTTWVSWKDKAGNIVAGSLAEARKSGAENPAQVPTEEIRNITDARQAVHLINKQGSPEHPETQGVLQLAEALNKEDKMGVFTSRYNAFMTKGVGAMPNDDPRIVTLLDKSQLLMTLALKAHFGASGGRSPQILEHFIAMANAGKMDGPTFIGGVKAIGDYMGERAMMSQQEQGGGGGKGPAVGTVEGGYKFNGGDPADKKNWVKQ